MTPPIILILGAGPRVGAAVAEKFATNGYKIALASRKATGGHDEKGYLSIQADFTKPDAIPAVFETVKSQLGSAPAVVVYNAATFTPPSDKESALSIPATALDNDLNVNVVSAYVAAQQALAGFETLSKEVKKTFIYTGNITNKVVLPMPSTLSLGVGKAASAYWVGVADGAYSAKGYRFFYADERHEDGKIKGMALDGPAHADFYAELATHGGGIPWDATFAKGKGYIKF